MDNLPKELPGKCPELLDDIARIIYGCGYQLIIEPENRLVCDKLYAIIEQKVDELTQELEESEDEFQQAFNNFKLQKERAEKAEATSYLPMIPEGEMCLGCPFWVADYCRLTHSPVEQRTKNPACPKPYIEPKPNGKYKKCHEPHLRNYPDCFEECGCDECESLFL